MFSNDFADFEESSRALATDSEFSDLTQSLTTEYTPEGQAFKNAESEAKHILCVFSGFQGFAEAYINSRLSDVTLLSKTFTVHVDSEDELRRGRQLILSVYKMNQALFVIFDGKFELGHSFVQQLVNGEINSLLKSSDVAFIFQSESVAKFRNNYFQQANYFLKSTTFNDKKELQGLIDLPVPNIISGFGAAVLTHCEKEDKPCLQIINYLDNNDTTDHPFFQFIQSSPKLKSVLTFHQPALSKNIRSKTDSGYLFT